MLFLTDVREIDDSVQPFITLCVKMTLEKCHNFKEKIHFLGHLMSVDGIGTKHYMVVESKKISNDQKLKQSDPTSSPQNQKGNT